jgi:hypothetical protein
MREVMPTGFELAVYKSSSMGNYSCRVALYYSPVLVPLYCSARKEDSSDDPVASGSGGDEIWHLLVTSFGALQFALRIFHYRWQKCSQTITGQY